MGIVVQLLFFFLKKQVIIFLKYIIIPFLNVSPLPFLKPGLELDECEIRNLLVDNETTQGSLTENWSTGLRELKVPNGQSSYH